MSVVTLLPESVCGETSPQASPSRQPPTPLAPVVTNVVVIEMERGDRRVGLVMFAVTVTQPEPGQPANQTMTPTSGSPALTK